MSGSSFGYAHRVYTLDDFFEKRHEVARLCEALKAYGGSELALSESEALLSRLADLEAHLLRATTDAGSKVADLRRVWEAVARHHSGDAGEEEVHKAIAEYHAAHDGGEVK